MNQTKVVIVGGGAMGGALADGLVKAGWTAISVVEPSSARRAELAARQINAYPDAQAAGLSQAEVLLLAVKPKLVAQVAGELASQLSNQLVISIAAGVRLAQLAELFGEQAAIVRVMPNTPAQVGAGMSVYSPNANCSPSQAELAGQLLAAVGEALELPETAQDVATAISGSGPAYVAYLAEAMIDAGVELCLTRDQATVLVNQTLLGTAKLLASGKDPVALRHQVTSPAGTTAAAIAAFEAAGVRAGIAAGVRAAEAKSASL